MNNLLLFIQFFLYIHEWLSDSGWFIFCILPISPAFTSKANLSWVNLVISTEGFGNLWTLLVSPICISTSVSHDLLYPVKADLPSVVLFQEVFCHSCVCVCTMVCDGSSDFSPFIPGQCGTTGRVDVLEVLRVSEDQQQNQIKCHLDCSEWRDCFTAQGNGFALHLYFGLGFFFFPWTQIYPV